MEGITSTGPDVELRVIGTPQGIIDTPRTQEPMRNMGLQGYGDRSLSVLLCVWWLGSSCYPHKGWPGTGVRTVEAMY